MDGVSPGLASIKLSFDAWKGVQVAPTSHSIEVRPFRALARAEPIAPNLIASLIHPVEKANVSGIKFSSDGKRLFTSGYNSGIVQLWDVVSKKEVLRIETNSSPGTHKYAHISPDWTRLYVPVEKRKIRRIETDGKVSRKLEFSGLVQVWDLTTGKALPSLMPGEGSAPVSARVSPCGRFLVCAEVAGTDGDANEPKVISVVWELASGKKWKLCDGFVIPSFAPDGNTVALNFDSDDRRSSVVNLLKIATGKEIAKLTCPDKDRTFDIGEFSPNGRLVAVFLVGKKGVPVEVLFLDAMTLEERGKLIGKGDPDERGWSDGTFTPDGKHFVAFDGIGNVLVWNVAERKLERTLPLGSEQRAWKLTISPDGKMIAAAWRPKADASIDNSRDPEVLPQARVTLLDIAGKSPPRILIAPHGYVGGLAFSPDGKTLAFGGAGAVHLFDLTK